MTKSNLPVSMAVLILTRLLLRNSVIRLYTICTCSLVATSTFWRWSGGAMVLGKLPVPGRPMDYSRARTYCACSRCCWGFLDIFTLLYPFSPLSPSLWETARYRLKYCLKGPLNPKQQQHFLALKKKFSYQPTNPAEKVCIIFYASLSVKSTDLLIYPN